MNYKKQIKKQLYGFAHIYVDYPEYRRDMDFLAGTYIRNNVLSFFKNKRNAVKIIKSFEKYYDNSKYNLMKRQSRKTLKTLINLYFYGREIRELFPSRPNR